MITGTTPAQTAVLIVDVKEGIVEQGHGHSYLINMMGIDRVMVVFNKMDIIDYDNERFEKIRTELLEFLRSLRIKLTTL